MNGAQRTQLALPSAPHNAKAHRQCRAQRPNEIHIEIHICIFFIYCVALRAARPYYLLPQCVSLYRRRKLPLRSRARLWTYILVSVVLFIVAACAYYILFLIMFNPPDIDDGKRLCGSVRTEHIPRSNQEKENEKKRRRRKSKNATHAPPLDWMRSVCVRRSSDRTAEFVDVCALGSSRRIHTIPTT